jgi:micrococcal nuclease
VAPTLRNQYLERGAHDLAVPISTTVRVDERGIDRYEHTLGTIRVGGTDIHAVLVRSGAAWVFRRHSDDPALMAAEEDARRGRRGLRAAPDPIPPWN